MKKTHFMLKILLGALLLNFLVGCSKVTVLRTQEIRSVETNLKAQIDSLELKLDSMKAEQVAFQRRMQADLGSLIGAQENGINRMVTLLEEMGYTVDKVAVNTEKIKNTKVKVEHIIRQADTTGQGDMRVTSLQEVEIEKLFTTAMNDFNAAQYQQAYKGFKSIYAKNPQGRRAEEALYWMAVCYERTEKYDWAVQVFQKLLKEFPEGQKMCTTQFQVARIAKNQGKDDEYQAGLKQLVENPKCKGTNEALRAEAELKQ